MALTKKVCGEILSRFPLKNKQPSLPVADAERIRKQLKCSRLTVYKQWSKLRSMKDGDDLQWNEILLAIAELANKKKRVLSDFHNRVSEIEEQFSENGSEVSVR